MRDDLDDPLDELFGGSAGAPRPAARPTIAAEVQAAEMFIENCRKCGGSGYYRGLGRCFACKGKGKFEFKTSPQKRAENRIKSAARAVSKETTRWEEFAAAHPAEAAWMIANTAFEFAVSMRSAIEKYGHLTENQLAAVQRCIARAEVRKIDREERASNAPAVDSSKIEQAFTFARERASRPGMKGIWTRPMPLTSTEATGKQTMVFQIGKPGGKWEGCVFVQTQDGRKIGMLRGGKFQGRFGCTDAEQAAVLECASDPANAAKAYGKAYGVCCVCSRTLTNDGSIERGIGPICAGRFGW